MVDKVVLTPTNYWEHRKWVQGRYGQVPEVCLAHAVRELDGNYEHCRQLVLPFGSIRGFNDNPATTFADVLRVWEALW